jgi:hypothetical protein
MSTAAKQVANIILFICRPSSFFFNETSQGVCGAANSKFANADVSESKTPDS